MGEVNILVEFLALDNARSLLSLHRLLVVLAVRSGLVGLLFPGFLDLLVVLAVPGRTVRLVLGFLWVLAVLVARPFLEALAGLALG